MILKNSPSKTYKNCQYFANIFLKCNVFLKKSREVGENHMRGFVVSRSTPRLVLLT